MSVCAKKQKHSLVSPDFTGLWSVAWISSDSSIKTSIFSSIAVFILLFSWIFGYIFVIIDLLLLIYFHNLTAFIIFSCILFVPSYLFNLGRSPKWCRFLMNGAKYFEGGCSWSIENKQEIIPEIHYNRAGDYDTLNKAEMYCYHPHGVFTFGFIWNGGIRMSAATDFNDSFTPEQRSKYVSKQLSNVQVFPRHGMASKMLIYSPIMRHLFVDLCGCVWPSDKKNFVHLMKNDIAFGVTIGGFYEVGLFKRGIDSIYIKNKKGFIKYSLQYGYTIYPVYTFGECETYFNLRIQNQDKKSNNDVHWLITFLSKWHIPALLFIHGPYWFMPFLPYWKGVGIHSIVGDAIKCPKIAKPTQADIDKYHKIYFDAVVGLYERNKWRFGQQDRKLEIH